MEEPNKLVYDLEKQIFDSGPKAVDGWFPTTPLHLREFVSDGVSRSMSIDNGPFDNPQEILDFMRADADYEENNSFFYDFEDVYEQNSEGFFQDFYCDKCLNDLLMQLMGEDIPRNDLADPFLEPIHHKRKTDSYMDGHEKIIESYWVRCDAHPEMYAGSETSFYREK